MSPFLLRLENLGVSYGRQPVIKDLSLNVEHAVIHGVVGPNGSGKSTLMRSLLGDRKLSGSVHLAEIPLANNPLLSKTLIGYAPDSHMLPAKMSVTEYLSCIAAFKQEAVGWRQTGDELVGLLDLAPYMDHELGQLSLGTKQKVALIAALIGRQQKLLVFDEATTGLDPISLWKFHQYLRNWVAATGYSVLYCSHHLAPIKNYLQSLSVLMDGQILHNWDRQAFASDFLVGNMDFETRIVQLMMVGKLSPSAD